MLRTNISRFGAWSGFREMLTPLASQPAICSGASPAPLRPATANSALLRSAPAGRSAAGVGVLGWTGNRRLNRRWPNAFKRDAVVDRHNSGQLRFAIGVTSSLRCGTAQVRISSAHLIQCAPGELREPVSTPRRSQTSPGPRRRRVPALDGTGPAYTPIRPDHKCWQGYR